MSKQLVLLIDINIKYNEIAELNETIMLDIYNKKNNNS